MKWRETIEARLDEAYKATEGLLEKVSAEDLEWKPEQGEKWMSMGQLLHHLSSACGSICKGFVTGEWCLPGGNAPEGAPPPGAEEMPSAGSLGEARRTLLADKDLAYEMLARCDEKELAEREMPAPWNPTPRCLGYQFLVCVDHLASHKAQLFYYLKLQGKPVDTRDLWGLG